MIASGVINRFIVLVDPSALGYSRVVSFALKKDLIDKETIEKIKQIGDIQFEFTVLGGVKGFSLLTKDESQSHNRVENMVRFLQPALLGAIVQDQLSDEKLKIKKKLKRLDYQIIRQLVLNPRIELHVMAKSLSVSSKTISRRLDKLQENHILEFTVLPNPREIKGHVVFFIDIKIKSDKKFKNVSENIYHQLQDYLILSRIFNSKDTIGLVLVCEAIIDVENIRSLIEIIDGVCQCRVFLSTTIEYNQETILDAIDRVSLEVL